MMHALQYVGGARAGFLIIRITSNFEHQNKARPRVEDEKKNDCFVRFQLWVHCFRSDGGAFLCHGVQKRPRSTHSDVIVSVK